MSTQVSTNLAERLRVLRGERSQEEFAKLVGLTRAALANYETGRTTPKPSVLRAISEKLGLSDDFLKFGGFRNEYELNLIATGEGVPDRSYETDDELAIIRALRAVRPSTIEAIVSLVLDDIAEQPSSREELKGLSVQQDIARLGAILKAGGAYSKGSTKEEEDAILAALARRAKLG